MCVSGVAITAKEADAESYDRSDQSCNHCTPKPLELLYLALQSHLDTLYALCQCLRRHYVALKVHDIPIADTRPSDF